MILLPPPTPMNTWVVRSTDTDGDGTVDGPDGANMTEVAQKAAVAIAVKNLAGDIQQLPARERCRFRYVSIRAGVTATRSMGLQRIWTTSSKPAD